MYYWLALILIPVSQISLSIYLCVILFKELRNEKKDT